MTRPGAFLARLFTGKWHKLHDMSSTRDRLSSSVLQQCFFLNCLQHDSERNGTSAVNSLVAELPSRRPEGGTGCMRLWQYVRASCYCDILFTLCRPIEGSDPWLSDVRGRHRKYVYYPFVCRIMNVSGPLRLHWLQDRHWTGDVIRLWLLWLRFLLACFLQLWLPRDRFCKCYNYAESIFSTRVQWRVGFIDGITASFVIRKLLPLIEGITSSGW